MTKVSIVIALCLVVSACFAEAQESEEIARARLRANAHLSYLRAGNWEKAADSVVVITYVNSSYLQIPLDSPSSPERSRLRSKAIEILSRVYGHVKPGDIHGLGVLVSGDYRSEVYGPQNVKHVRFSYHHDDLDGLDMLWVGGNWYRVIETYE